MKTTQMLIKEGICRDSSLRHTFVKSISIYKTGLVKDPISNTKTLRLLLKLDSVLSKGNKEEACSVITDFIKNTNGSYTNEYGKAKDHMETIICNSPTKLSNHDVLNYMGFPSEVLINRYGITINNKRSVITTAFELVSIETIKRKYGFISNVVYCGDGKIKTNCYNGTGQKNFDVIISLQDSAGNTIYIAFDHKVKEFETCIKDIEKSGFKYHIYTLGDVEDDVFINNPKIKKAIIEHDYSKVFSDSLESDIFKVETVTNVSKMPELLTQTLQNVDIWSKNEDSQLLVKSALMPFLLANTKDLAETIVKMQTEAGLPPRTSSSFLDIDD